MYSLRHNNHGTDKLSPLIPPEYMDTDLLKAIVFRESFHGRGKDNLYATYTGLMELGINTFNETYIDQAFDMYESSPITSKERLKIANHVAFFSIFLARAQGRDPSDQEIGYTESALWSVASEAKHILDDESCGINLKNQKAYYKKGPGFFKEVLGIASETVVLLVGINNHRDLKEPLLVPSSKREESPFPGVIQKCGKVHHDLYTLNKSNPDQRSMIGVKTRMSDESLVMPEFNLISSAILAKKSSPNYKPGSITTIQDVINLLESAEESPESSGGQFRTDLGLKLSSVVKKGHMIRTKSLLAAN